MNQRREVLAKLWKQKKTTPFFRECVFFGRMYETFTDWLEIGPEASKDTNFKKRVGLFRFSKFIPRNGIRRNVYW